MHRQKSPSLQKIISASVAGKIKIWDVSEGVHGSGMCMECACVNSRVDASVRADISA